MIPNYEHLQTINPAISVVSTSVLIEDGCDYRVQHSDAPLETEYVVVCKHRMAQIFNLQRYPEKIILVGSTEKKKLQVYLKSIYFPGAYSKIIPFKKVMIGKSSNYLRKRFLWKSEVVSTHWILHEAIERHFKSHTFYGAVIFEF